MVLNPYDGTSGLAGAGIGVRGQCLEVNDDGSFSGGAPAWGDATLMAPRLVRFFVDQVGNGLAIGSENFNEQVNGTANSTSAVTPDATHQLVRRLSATSSAGRAGRTYYFANFGSQIQLGAASSQHTYECLFTITTLSDGTDTHTLTLGYFDTLTGASTDGLYLEINSNTDTEAQFITRANSAETKTDTGVTIAAGTWYRLRIVVTNNTTVSCYLAAEGSPLGAAKATHTTNIPSGSSRLVGIGNNLRKSAGSNARTVDYTYQIAIHDRFAA